MAGQWYIQDNQRATGPFTAAQIKAQAENSRIKPETLVRKGARGNWVAAARVKGLLSAVQLQQSAPVSTQPPATTTAEATAKIDDEEEFFAPLRNRRKRFIIFALLVGFALIGPSPWLHKAIFFLSMGLIFGSYPIVQVKQRTIEQTMIVSMNGPSKATAPSRTGSCPHPAGRAPVRSQRHRPEPTSLLSVFHREPGPPDA